MHCPIRRSSGASSGDDDSLNNDPDQPVISKLFSDAALYDKCLAEHGLYAQGAANCISGFVDLIGGDLTSPEKAVTNRLAKLSVTGDSWTSTELTSDPESYDTDSDSESTGLKSPDSVQVEPTPVLPRSSTLDGERWKLEPEEIVNLLVEEFGALTAEGEEEKAIIEADGALFHQDVLILVRELRSTSIISIEPQSGRG